MADITSLTQEQVNAAFDQALKYGLDNGTITQETFRACKSRQFPVDCVISAYAPAAKLKKRVRGEDDTDDPQGYTQVRYNGVKYHCHRIAARVAGLALSPGQEASPTAVLLWDIAIDDASIQHTSVWRTDLPIRAGCAVHSSRVCRATSVHTRSLPAQG
jgi:hypothetical protein